ncbi:MAG: hypothetical protein ABI678_15335 [Kofleriaceae bacterium]
MNERAWFQNGYEQCEGELELRIDALLFNRKKNNRAGTFAAFGLLGLALTNAYEHWITIPRYEIRGGYPSPTSDREFAVYTTRGTMLVFVVGAQNRHAWLQAIGLLPPGG